MSDFSNFRGVKAVESEAGGVSELSYAPDGRRFVAACVSGVAKVFDSSSAGRLLCTLDPRAGRVVRVVWSPCGRTIALGTTSGDIVLYDALMGAELRRWDAGRAVHLMAFSPCGMRLLSGCAIEPVVRVWCPATARLICEISEENNDPVISAFFLPGDGGASLSVISVGFAGRVSINSASDGSLLRRLELGAGDVITMALSPSGSHIAVTFFNNTARAFSVADGSEVSRLLRVSGRHLRSVAWGSDSIVVGGGADSSVTFFDVTRNAELHSVWLPGGRSVWNVAARPDGHQVLVGCDDGRIHLLAGE